MHDGPEFAELGGFTQYLGAAIASGAIPPVRAALLGPGDRNDWYSANAAYAATDRGRGRADGCRPSTVRIGVGISLGALAMLHLHRTCPGVLGGAVAAVGQLLHPRLRPAGSRLQGFAAVTEFVASVHDADADEHPVPAALTCGVLEENLANNKAMTATFGGSASAALHEVRDTHNYTAWRDALHPHLTDCSRPWRRTCGVTQVELGPAKLIAYGHWGRPVLVFPSEQGRAWDFENNGMVGALADLIDGGRLKLYCVDSADGWSWSHDDDEARAPELLLHDSAIEASVAGWLAELNPRQRMVIERRYGLNACEVTTLEDLAAELGVTRERVRQIQGEALDKLRGKLERRGYTKDALF